VLALITGRISKCWQILTTPGIEDIADMLEAAYEKPYSVNGVG